MSQTEINFLDTKVFKVDNKLRTKVYVRSDKVIYTVNQNILIPLKKYIAYSQELKENFTLIIFFFVLP